MIKQVWIAQCDICGKEEKAKLKSGQYNEDNPILPDGWMCGYNTGTHMCRECARKLAEGKRNGTSE